MEPNMTKQDPCCEDHTLCTSFCISRGLTPHHVNEVLHLKGPYVAPCEWGFASQGALCRTMWMRFCISRGLTSHHVNEVLHLKGPYIAPCVYCFTSQGALLITVYIRFLIWKGPHIAPCAWGFSSQRGLISYLVHKVSHLKENYISWGLYIAPCA